MAFFGLTYLSDPESVTEIQNRSDPPSANVDPLANTGTTSKTGVAKEFRSLSAYHEALDKHARLAYNPTQKFVKPVSTNMEYGWLPAYPIQPHERFPLSQTEISRFHDTVLRNEVFER
mmetsp:Transcript_44125/g.71843  ORF Transcript_44125/g.71843 Transcript_44125/m.71843 type:complete len:118 (-) Transcript_44125:418-771(-)|eukprot:CAMPEP_0184664890 /NCGR_PEP_ID=MMETSP0308-20130426/54766_1 /TAXON_ID=38269 /ORGANISM="Gloeochaete witrockiana, Strain SAG 46.84" /LENGTH=117 /DNA_ID=CAMNT_0027108561 /DNA_START=47 /DNA_END=400 /DNA_ORIENTATION=-